MLKVSQFLIVIPFSLVISCGSGSTGDDMASAETSSMEERIKGGYTVGKDAQGNPKMKSTRRSSFENSNFGGAQGEIAGDSFSKKQFSSNRWSGRRSFQKSSFAGNRQAQGYGDAPHYLQKNAGLAQNSRFSGQGYSTRDYATRASRESGSRYATSANAYAESRRDKRPEPPVTTFREEQKLSVEDTNELLGR